MSGKRLFAQLNDQAKVLRVIAAPNLDWCESRLGGAWVETRRDGSEQFGGPDMGFDRAHPKRFALPWTTDGQTQLPDGTWLYNTQGQHVFHNGKVWTNLLPAGTPNVWEPGVANWREYQVGERYTLWVQPTGAFDAYPQGFRVEHNGKEWESDVNANVWEPGVANWTDLNPVQSDEWQPSVSYAVNDEVEYQGLTYRCRQSHTSQAGWEPPNVPALWEVVG